MIHYYSQENYLKTEPAKLRNFSGPEKTLEQLRLMDQAASSISDGDLVDALIHGYAYYVSYSSSSYTIFRPEQHWSLMPLHAVTSSIRPASFIYGPGSGYGGPNAMSFPQCVIILLQTALALTACLPAQMAGPEFEAGKATETTG